MITEKVFAIIKRDAITALRYRNGFILAAGAQAAQFATFYYLARSVGPQFRPDGMPYFLFLLVGTGFYTFLLAGVHSFLRTIQESQQTGTLEILLTSSTSPPTLVFLSAFSSFAGGLFQFVLLLAAGLVVGASAIHANVGACLLVFALSLLITFALGLFSAGVQISTHKGSAVLWLIGSGSWLLSGTLFPVSALPRFARLLAYCVPFTHSLLGLRLALLNGSSSALMREIEVLALFSLLLVPLSVLLFSSAVRHARQSGTLAFY
ncbi:MAG TPA: ABC transporter permease [Terriglobales bacterium]|nr:ABC transporter permease [Terriglobales bacterium]